MTGKAPGGHPVIAEQATSELVFTDRDVPFFLQPDARRVPLAGLNAVVRLFTRMA